MKKLISILVSVITLLSLLTTVSIFAATDGGAEASSNPAEGINGITNLEQLAHTDFTAITSDNTLNSAGWKFLRSFDSTLTSRPVTYVDGGVKLNTDNTGHLVYDGVKFNNTDNYMIDFTYTFNPDSWIQSFGLGYTNSSVTPTETEWETIEGKSSMKIRGTTSVDSFQFFTDENYSNNIGTAMDDAGREAVADGTTDVRVRMLITAGSGRYAYITVGDDLNYYLVKNESFALVADTYFGISHIGSVTGQRGIVLKDFAVYNFEFDLSDIQNHACGAEGDNLMCSFEPTTGELTISGEGKMAENNIFPWSFFASAIKKVTFSDGVISIGKNAFSGCTGLTSIEIPDSVTSIGENAFSGCTNLEFTKYGNAKYLGNKNNLYLYLHEAISTDITSATIHSSTKLIGSKAFYGCTGLTGVYITDIAAWCGYEFEVAGNNPLCWAHNLYLNGELVKELVIPDGVTSIADYAFYGCESLTSVEIPDSVTEIGEAAFAVCTNLTSITIPHSVTEINVGAFNGCTSLTGVYITDISAWCKINFGVSDLSGNSNPLYWAHNLYLKGELVRELVIPDGVTSIADYAFYGCESLTSVTIPNSVTSIGTDAFYNCTNLTCVAIGNGLTTINAGAFSTCTNLSEVSYCGSESQWAVLAQSFPSTISVTRHNYSISEITTKPTHMTEGVKTFTCTFCGDTKTEKVDKLPEHEYGSWGIQNTTQHIKFCPCGDTVYADHTWDNGVVTIVPTHLADGQKTYTCSDCGETKFETVAKTTEHTYGEWGKHNAEQHKKVCACGDTVYADHTWDNGVITTQPTVEIEGVKTCTCTECGETKTEAVEKLKPEETTAATTVADTTVTSVDTTENSDNENKKEGESAGGCGSYLGGGVSVILLASGFSAFTFRKKKKVK